MRNSGLDYFLKESRPYTLCKVTIVTVSPRGKPTIRSFHRNHSLLRRCLWGKWKEYKWEREKDAHRCHMTSAASLHCCRFNRAFLGLFSVCCFWLHKWHLLLSCKVWLPFSGVELVLQLEVRRCSTLAVNWPQQILKSRALGTTVRGRI